MAISSRVTHPCSRCAQPVEVELHPSFVIDGDEALRTITENRFHVVACGRCGERRTFEADFLVTNQKRDLFLQVVARDADVPAAIARLRSLLGDAPVHARIVESRNHLVDKVRVWAHGLDDVAVEIVKFFIRLQMKDLAGTSRSFFERIENDHLVFATVVPGKPTELTWMPLSVYHNVIRDCRTATYARELEVDGRLAQRALEASKNKPSAPPQPRAPVAAAAPAPQPHPPPVSIPAPARASSPHCYLDLPFIAEHFGPIVEGRASLTCNAVSVLVDVATGGFAPRTVRYERQTLATPFATHGDLAIATEERATGPFTLVRAPDGRVVEIEGALVDLLRTEELIVAVVEPLTRGPECVAFTFGSSAPVRLPIAWRTPIVASDGVVACAGEGFVHVIRGDGARVSALTLPVPATPHPDVAIVAGKLCALAGNRLVIFDLAALPRGAERQSLAVELQGVRAPGVGLAEPARAVMALKGKLIVDHPKVGRMTLTAPPAGPTVGRGIEVMIDDVREELVGILRVYAWRAGQAPACITPQPPPMPLAAPDLAAIEAATQARFVASATHGSLAAWMVKLAVSHGFLLSPLLVQLLEARERDPVLTRWLDLLGLDLCGPAGLMDSWQADPSLLELAQLGNGDAHCLYVYPPWCQEGREPVVVTFRHETGFVDFEALSFADFLEQRLADPGNHAGLVALVRERLRLPARPIAAVTPPPWLPLDETWGCAKAPTLDEVRAIELRAGAVDAERAALHAYLKEGGTNAAAPARAELTRLYGTLGWSFALKNLATSEAEL